LLALLALYFVSPSLRPALAFTSGENATTVLGEPDYVTSLNPSGGLKLPSNLAFDSSGNLWVADAGHNRVLEETSPGGKTAVNTALGQSNLLSGRPALTQAGIDNPSGMAFDSSGNLWMTDTNNNRVLEFAAPISSGESATTVLGQSDFTTDGLSAAQSGMTNPAGVAFDSSGNLWVADSNDNRVLEFKPPFSNGMAASVVLGQPSLTSTITYTTASGLNFPSSVAFDSSGNLWVADGGNNRILEYKAPFGTGMSASLVIGQANLTVGASASTQAGFDSPGSIAFDSSGNLWVADTFNNRVLEFASPFANGMQATVVFGQASFTSHAAATTKSGMNAPTEVAFDKAGDLWVADSFNNRVLEFASPIKAAGTPSFVLGQTDYASNLDGGQQSLSLPSSVAFDKSGNLWTADELNNRVVEFASPLSTGTNATLSLGQASLTLETSGGGKGGLTVPFDAVFDSSGNLWVSDSGNNRILEFAAPFATGMNASLVIGQASFMTYANGTSASGLNFPAGIAFDSSGNLWVADAGNSRVLEFNPPFANGMSASLVIGQADFVSSTPGVSANRLYAPFSVAFDALGRLFVADSGNSRILGFSSSPFVNGEAATLVLGQLSFTARAPNFSQAGLDVPESLSFDHSGGLWVADSINNRVMEFTTFSNGATASVVLGQTTFGIGVAGTSQSTTNVPQGVVVDSAGNVWVADTYNNRLLRFSVGTITSTSSSSTSKTSTTTSTSSSTTSSSKTSTPSTSSTTTTSTTTSTTSSTRTTSSTTTASSSSSTISSSSSTTTTGSSSAAPSSSSSSSSFSTSSSTAKGISSSTNYTYYALAGIVVVVVVALTTLLARRSRQP
jgi:sugar lactone lactonase YvrE